MQFSFEVQNRCLLSGEVKLSGVKLFVLVLSLSFNILQPSLSALACALYGLKLLGQLRLFMVHHAKCFLNIVPVLDFNVKFVICTPHPVLDHLNLLSDLHGDDKYN